MSLEAERAIERLKGEYCFAIDDGRYEEWASLFTEDGRFVQGSDDAFEGYDELYEFGSELFDPLFETVTHVVTNPVIEVDGDEATGQWYLMFIYETSDGDVGWNQARYEDEYRRVDGEWRIAESVVVTRIEN
jgi:uncharacterized protein (TIGR02246 family)